MSIEEDQKSNPRERQNELFAEFETQSSKKPGSMFRHEIAFRKKITLNLSYENFVVMFIVAIMLMVVFFSLGVEKGKRVALRGHTPLTAEAFHASINAPAPENPKAKEIFISETSESDKVSAVGPASEREEVKVQPLPVKSYTIQVVAFKREMSAKKETKLLERKGHEVFIIPTKEWFQVCVGRYANKEESKVILDGLKEKYPTCYVRKIE